VRVVLRFVRVFLPSPASVALVRLVYLTVLFYLTIIYSTSFSRPLSYPASYRVCVCRESL
jgi:hypothetical protein